MYYARLLKVRVYFHSNLTTRIIDGTRMCEVLKEIIDIILYCSKNLSLIIFPFFILLFHQAQAFFKAL